VTYRCPQCGAESRRESECEECGMGMVKVCENCGELKSECACGGDVEEEGSEEKNL
jgi:hypothetical protein